VASRKKQKEALRREREERERQARESERRRRLIGYGAAGGLVVAAVAVVIVLLVAGGDGGQEASAEVLPDGGEVPDQQVTDLNEAARAAGCELKSRRVKRSELGETGNFHFDDIAGKLSDPFNPPTSGAHYVEPAEDGAYGEAPPVSTLVHTLEHGRVIIWFKPSLPKDARADLKALFDDDSFQMVITPRPKMPYAVAATAWNGEPQPLGTGRLLGCKKYGDKVFDALRTFRDEHRGNGREPVP
jgi:Protein of unknown function (DUF3105)